MNEIKKPEITVFIPIYNGEKYIKKSIDSILSQTFTDFELLIINDGSTDKSVEIINSYNDNRIRLIHNDINSGLTFTRNRGVNEARGNYIALLDADDIAYPDRLELQYNYLLKNNNIAICGGNGIYINANDAFIEDMSRDVGLLNLSLLFSNQLINSSVLMNIRFIKEFEGYHEKSSAEDYDLALRISQKYKIYNLPNKLVKYRLHEFNITKTQLDNLIKAEKEIAKDILSQLKINVSDENIAFHQALISPKHLNFSISKWIKYFKILKSSNYSNQFYTNKEFNKYLQYQYKIVFLSHKRSLNSIRYLYSSILIFKRLPLK